MADQDLKSIFDQATTAPDPSEQLKDNGHDLKAIFQEAHDAPTQTEQVADQSEDQKPQDWSKLQSFGQGALQGSTAGFSDELGGAEGAIQAKLLGNPEKKSLKDLYTEYRDFQRQRNEQAQKANPASNLAGNVAGAVGSAVLAPELMAPKSILGATALGAATGLGTSNADLTTGSSDAIKQASKDTLLGGALGAGAGAVGKGIQSALNPESLEVAGSKMASRAVGLKPSKELTRIYNPETGAMTEGSDVIKGIGKTAMDSGALPMTGGPDAIYDQSLKAIQTGYNKLNPILADTQQKLNQNLPDYLESAGHLGDKSANFLYDFRNSLGANPDQDAVMKKIEDKYMPYIQKLSDSDGNLQQLNVFKRGLQEKAEELSAAAYDNPASDLKPEAAFVKRLGGIVRQHIEDLATAADPGSGDAIHEINSDLGNLYTYKSAAKKLMDKPSQGLANLKTGAAATAGFIIGGPVGAAVSTVGKLGIEAGTGNSLGRLGQIAAARTLNQASKSIQTPVGQIIQKTLPQVPRAVVGNPFSQEQFQRKSSAPEQATKLTTSLYNATDDSLKQVASKFQQTPGLEFYADHLNKAIDTNDEGEKNRAIFLISQNPLTRKMVTEEN